MLGTLQPGYRMAFMLLSFHVHERKVPQRLLNVVLTCVFLNTLGAGV
jgi:hypothetical protein